MSNSQTGTQGTQGSVGAQGAQGSLTSTSPTLVQFYPLSNNSKYSQVTAALLGDSTYSQVQGSGGWQVVDRPKTIAATQWYDRSPFQLQMDLLIDDNFLGKGAGATETMCQQLESWLDMDSSDASNYQPTTFIMTGPLPGLVTSAGAREWFLYSLEFDEAIRSSPNTRIQQKLTVVCYEYNTPIPGGNSFATANSPAGVAGTFLATSAGQTFLGTQQTSSTGS